MSALRRHDRVLGDSGFVSRAGELRDRALIDILQRRWCEIAGVASVQGGPVEWLVNDIDPRTELVLVRERVHDVESTAEIDRELFERFPFILQIQSVEIAVLAGVIDDAQGNVAGLVAVGVDRENQCRRSDGGMLRVYKESAAERVLIVEFVARIQRDSVRENVAINP